MSNEQLIKSREAADVAPQMDEEHPDHTEHYETYTLKFVWEDGSYKMYIHFKKNYFHIPRSMVEAMTDAIERVKIFEILAQNYPIEEIQERSRKLSEA